MDIEVLSAYCMDCSQWVLDRDTHSCPINHWAITDKEMVGIVNSLYAMGITPMVAMWTSTEVIPDYEYLLSLRIDIESRINEAILGELPTGWKYHWETITPDKSELHLLGYVERWYYFGFETVDERLSLLIKEFEEFLHTKDAAAVKALLLLTSC